MAGASSVLAAIILPQSLCQSHVWPLPAIATSGIIEQSLNSFCTGNRISHCTPLFQIPHGHLSLGRLQLHGKETNPYASSPNSTNGQGISRRRSRRICGLSTFTLSLPSRIMLRPWKYVCAVRVCDSPRLSDSGGGRIMVPEGGPKDGSESSTRMVVGGGGCMTKSSSGTRCGWCRRRSTRSRRPRRRWAWASRACGPGTPSSPRPRRRAARTPRSRSCATRIARLRKQLKRAELEREILKKATAYFAKESL